MEKLSQYFLYMNTYRGYMNSQIEANNDTYNQDGIDIKHNRFYRWPLKTKHDNLIEKWYAYKMFTDEH